MPALPRTCATVATVALSVLSAVARADAPEGAGLQARADGVAWARFDARILTTAPPRWRAELAPFERSGLKIGGLLGDVYLGAAPVDAGKPPAGGFRATSGLVVGTPPLGSGIAGGLAGVQRRAPGVWSSVSGASAETAGDTVTVPYVGVGYSNAWPKSGWRVSADLGLLSYHPGSASGIGRVIGGSQSLDDLVRDMRLAPLVQLGVSYSF